jgi:hypothetical protein
MEVADVVRTVGGVGGTEHALVVKLSRLPRLVPLELVAVAWKKYWVLHVNPEIAPPPILTGLDPDPNDWTDVELVIAVVVP